MITLLRTPKLAQKWIHRHTARFTKVYFQSAVEQSEDNQLQKYIKNVPHLQFGSNLTSILQNKLFSYSISSILLSQDYTPSPTAILGIIFDFCNCFLKELQHYHDEIECSNSPTNSAALIEDFEACLDTVSSHLQSKGGGGFFYFWTWRSYQSWSVEYAIKQAFHVLRKKFKITLEM